MIISFRRGTFLKRQILMFFLFYKFENVNADLMLKGKKEMTNVKDVLHKSQAFPLITYHQSEGNTFDMQ